MRRATLRMRLFLSYAAVVVVGAAVLILVLVLLAPRLFDQRVAGMGLGPGRGTRLVALHQAFSSAMARSIAAAVAASLIAAAVAATLVARRLLRPVDRIREAAARLAAGRYDEPVRLPSEPELAALAGDLNRLADALADTERRRSTLIGDVAHEMRTPLTTARGYVDGLADGMFAADEAVAALGDEINRLERLAADLAAVSRAEEGRIELRPASIDAADVVGAVTDRLRPQFAANGVALVTRLRPAPVQADADRLAQAVTNLVGNALTYTASGGTVTVATDAENGASTVTVADTGVGLDPADLERIFERFYRAHPEGRAGGTGVGLTIARAIARAHGGELSAASLGLGRGSVFTLRLPARTV